MSYYYFISTLPSLVFGESPPLSSSDFIDDAKKWVSNSDWQGLNAALSGYDACIKLPAYKMWAEWETASERDDEDKV